MEGSTDAVFDVCSGRQYIGVVRDVFRDLISDWSQQITQDLKEENKPLCHYFDDTANTHLMFSLKTLNDLLYLMCSRAGHKIRLYLVSLSLSKFTVRLYGQTH